MAIPNSSLHIRSNSLPSTSHPLDASIEDHLRRLRASQAGPSSSSSISQNLVCIKDLYEQMSNSIHLPHNQKGLSRKDVEEVLEGSLVLLDASSSAMNAVSQMKEYILDLQSSLRRGNGEEGIRAYLVSRKKISKMVFKCLVDLKKSYKNDQTYLQNDAMTMKMLKEAEAISLSTLKSILSFVMGKKSTSHSWSVVAKLVKSKNVSSKSDEAGEVEEVDRTLRSVSQKQLSAETTMVLLKQLDALETAIHELEDDLESVSRCFVKTRVSLLNLLNY